MRAPPTNPDPPVTNAVGTATTLTGQRFCRFSPHCQPLHGLCEISLIFALPLLSRVRRKLVHAVFYVLSVSMKFPRGFAIETR